jgi:hypothetical protein
MTKENIFKYLNDLRDSGVTNMWGASAYLERDLGLSKREAKDALLEWIASFNK